MAEETQQKWQGKATAKVVDYTAEQIWSLVSDYCNLDKWLPFIDTCTLVEGTPGQPGCVRYCGIAVPAADGVEGRINWAKEKLLAINPLEHCYTYEITENNVGFKAYVATVKLIPATEDTNQKGCVIEWSFVSDPAQGWKYEDLLAYLHSTLDTMTRSFEKALQNASK